MLTNAPQELSAWQLVFLQSKVNGAPYQGEELPQHRWNWPQDTCFQRRLRALKGTRIRSRAEIERNLFREIFEVEHRKEGVITRSSLLQSEV